MAMTQGWRRAASISASPYISARARGVFWPSSSLMATSTPSHLAIHTLPNWPRPSSLICTPPRRLISGLQVTPPQKRLCLRLLHCITILHKVKPSSLISSHLHPQPFAHPYFAKLTPAQLPDVHPTNMLIPLTTFPKLNLSHNRA